MGGYVKGIVTGLASFVLGFAVLSLVMPVEPPSPEPAATNGSETQPTHESAPEAPAAEAPQEAVTQDWAPEPGTPEPEIDEPEIDEPRADESGTPEPGTAGPADPEPAAMAGPVADPAPASEAPVTEASPPIGDTPVLAPALAPASEPLNPASSEPAPDAEATTPETAPDAAPEPVPGPRTPGPAPSPDATPAEETGQPDAPASEVIAAEPAPAETAPAPDAGTAGDQSATTTPAREQAAQEQAGEAPADVPDTAPNPTASPAEETAQEAAPEPPLTPVPAPATPANEPLLAQPQTGLPRVQPMPSGAPGVAVRRGGGETLGRLPTIGAQPSAPEPAPEPAAEPAAAEPDPDLPALERFAAIPALPGGEAPLGVVLTDLAETGSAAETAILAFPVPVTVVLDPYDPDAPRRARIYRAAGHEIALRAASLPALARPSDLAVTLDAWQRAFPGVVAFVDVPINGLGANAQLAREFAGMLEPDGYGVIALRDGLDAFLQAGRAAGLATAPVYRTLDDEDQSDITIRRLLDRAAFEALRQPGILVAGSAANADTMAELRDFAGGRGRAGVALVPASAVLTRR